VVMLVCIMLTKVHLYEVRVNGIFWVIPQCHEVLPSVPFTSLSSHSFTMLIYEGQKEYVHVNILIELL